MYNRFVRAILRAIIFSFIALLLAQRVIGGLVLGGNVLRTLALVLFGLSLLNFFMLPVLRILSLPTDGIGFAFISFMLTVILLYILTIFVPNLEIVESTLPQLRIFGVVLPSKGLTVFWSAVFTSLLISSVYNFFVWLTGGK